MVNKTRVHIIVSGSVHGVTFRAATIKRARILGLRGWVKNISEGVEAIIEGDAEKVEQISEWMKHGPPSADVYGIDIENNASPREARSEVGNFCS